MDAVVQFVRNALCCVKDCMFFKETIPWLYDPDVTMKYIYNDLPHPLNQTTPLEVMICLTQFYAHYSLSSYGFSLILNGFTVLRNTKTVISVRTSAKENKMGKVADVILDQRLNKDKKEAAFNIFTGVLALAIGVSFFWLFANSLHVTSTDWIGGLPGLIHALIVMEVALVPFLYFMVKDGMKKRRESKQLAELAEKLISQKQKVSSELLMDEQVFTWIAGSESKWEPFWNTYLKISNDDFISKYITAEVMNVGEIVKYLTSDKGHDEDTNIFQKKLGQRLKSDAFHLNMEGWREYAYFIFNLFAFYGYSISILCYYFEEDENRQQPNYYVSQYMMKMDNETADWSGNFLGDLMWTLEPLVIMSSPIFFMNLESRTKKMKKD